MHVLPTHLIGSVAFSPDGNSLVTYDKELCLRNVKTGKVTKTIAKDVNPEAPVMFSHNGRFLAYASADIFLFNRKNPTQAKWISGHLIIYDLRNGKRQVLAALFPASFCFSPNDDVLVATTSPILPDTSRLSGQQIAFKTSTGQTLWTQNHTNLEGLAFSPDGRWLASEYKSYGVEIKQITTGKIVRVLDAPENKGGFHTSISTIAWSPDGTTIACIDNNDQDIKLWDVSDLH